MSLIQGGTEAAVMPLCDALMVSRATVYRHLDPKPAVSIERTCHRAMSAEERQHVLATLTSDEFRDQSPATVYGTLLDNDTYLCSIRSMYRILEESNLVRERRNQLVHPPYQKPELIATGPNQVWSWDITKLKGPRAWGYFHLYVILDIFSRYVVGWMVAEREGAELGKRLIATTVERQGVDPQALTVHADRGSPMRSKAVVHLMADLGITRTHSRPYTSTDNPFSEAAFKTMKYCPEFPARFGSLKDAEVFCRAFFDWYNNRHRHSGLGLMTPADVHFDRATALTEQRQVTLTAAFNAHPERFVKGLPRAPRPPEAVWINPPDFGAGRKENAN